MSDSPLTTDSNAILKSIGYSEILNYNYVF